MRMKEKVKTRNNWFIWLIIGFGIGVTIGRLVDWGYFELSKEVSIIDALNIFITIGLTLYIASVLEKRLKSEQFKSDLYVAKINEIECQIKQIEELLLDNNIEYQKINTRVHVIALAKNSLMQSIYSFQIGIEAIKEIDASLKNKHKEFKMLLTDRPIDKQDKSVVVKNNIVTYSSGRIAEIIAISYAIKEDFFRLKVLLSE